VEVHQLILGWLPQAEVVMIPGAGHFLALTHAPQVATAIASFLHRHEVSA
jgi:pimeloyl-ACP methyl ester carboxylesterase